MVIMSIKFYQNDLCGKPSVFTGTHELDLVLVLVEVHLLLLGLSRPVSFSSHSVAQRTYA